MCVHIVMSQLADTVVQSLEIGLELASFPGQIQIMIASNNKVSIVGNLRSAFLNVSSSVMSDTYRKQQ